MMTPEDRAALVNLIDGLTEKPEPKSQKKSTHKAGERFTGEVCSNIPEGAYLVYKNEVRTPRLEEWFVAEFSPYVAIQSTLGTSSPREILELVVPEKSKHKAGEPFTGGCYCLDKNKLPIEGLEYAGEWRCPKEKEWRVVNGEAFITEYDRDIEFEILRPRKQEHKKAFIIPIIGTVGEGGKVTFFSEKKNPSHKTTVTTWDALARENSCSFTGEPDSEPDFERIVKETGLGTEEGAWVVRIEREGGLPKGFAGEKYSQDFDGELLDCIVFYHKRLVPYGDYGGASQVLKNHRVWYHNQAIDEAIKAIDDYWTTTVGDTKVRAYETADGGHLKCFAPNGNFYLTSPDILSRDLVELLRALLTNSGVKIMPYKLSEGGYSAPK